MGVIGQGPRGRYVLSHFLKEPDVQVVAICDAFADRRAESKEMVDKHYGNSACLTYRQHEQILERNDIDGVLIATGNRWHAVLSALAARAGKDVYCEKPFTLTIAEGRALVDTMKRYGTVSQCGMQRHSDPGYQFIYDVIHAGRIGKLQAVTLSFGDFGGGSGACRLSNRNRTSRRLTTTAGWDSRRGCRIQSSAPATVGASIGISVAV